MVYGVYIYISNYIYIYNTYLLWFINQGSHHWWGHNPTQLSRLQSSPTPLVSPVPVDPQRTLEGSGPRGPSDVHLFRSATNDLLQLHLCHPHGPRNGADLASGKHSRHNRKIHQELMGRKHPELAGLPAEVGWNPRITNLSPFCWQYYIYICIII